MAGFVHRIVRRRVAAWQSAGIVDSATADRILSFEQAAPGPQMHGALALLGGFAVALGLVSVVAANWDELPIWLKLGGHLVLNAGLAMAAWLRPAPDDAEDSDRWREVLLLLLSVSTLALLAHVGQSFQLQGSTFGLMLGWFLLTTPFVLALARSGFNRWLWTLGLLTVVWLGMGEHTLWLNRYHLFSTVPALTIVALAAPSLLPGATVADSWPAHLRRVALAGLAGIASTVEIGWRLDLTGSAGFVLRDVLTGAGVATVGLALVALAGRALRGGSPFGSPRVTALVLASPVYAALPFLVGGADSPVLAGAAFCFCWLAVAGLALESGSAGLFRLAVAVLALRLFAVYLEAFGGLLATGVGLILAGLLLLALGLTARRLMAWAAALRAESGGPGGRGAP